MYNNVLNIGCGWHVIHERKTQCKKQGTFYKFAVFHDVPMQVYQSVHKQQYCRSTFWLVTSPLKIVKILGGRFWLINLRYFKLFAPLRNQLYLVKTCIFCAFRIFGVFSSSIFWPASTQPSSLARYAIELDAKTKCWRKFNYCTLNTKMKPWALGPWALGENSM